MSDYPVLLREMADSAGLAPAAFWATMQEMSGCREASRENYLGLLLVAQQYKLNPLLRQLYLMKTQRGVQVVIPVDGYVKLMTTHPDYLGSEVVTNRDDKGYVESITVIIHRRDQTTAGIPPFSHTEYMIECRGNSGPWKSHPIRMLTHKAYSQGVRYCFGIYLPDENEWERAAEVAGPAAEAPATTPAIAMSGMTAPEPAAVEIPDAEVVDVPPPEAMHGAADGQGGTDAAQYMDDGEFNEEDFAADPSMGASGELFPGAEG